MIGVSPGSHFEPGFLDALAKAARVVFEQSPPSVGADRDLERLQRPGRDRGREGVGKEIGPRPLPEEVDDRLGRGDEAAHAPAQRLAEGASDDVDAVASASQRRRAAALFAQMSGRMAVVDQHQRAVAVGEAADLLQLGDVAVHREHAVGGDELEARVRARRPP